MPLRKSWLWLLIASIGLSLAVPFILGGLGQFKLLGRMPWWTFVLFNSLMIMSWAFNSWRTQFLMRAGERRVRFWKAALVTISAEFAGVTTPGSVGMPATYTFLFHNLGVGVAEAVGLVGLIVVTDLAFFGTLMPLAAIFQWLEGGATHSSLSLAASIVVVVVGSILFLWLLGRNYRRVCSFVGWQMGKVSRLARYRYRLARGTVQFVQSLRLLQKMSWLQWLGLFLITFGFWMPPAACSSWS